MKPAENNGGKKPAVESASRSVATVQSQGHRGQLDRDIQQQKPNNKPPKAKVVYKSIWKFWVNHPIGIFCLMVGFYLMTPLLEFPGGGNPQRLWYVVGGACLLATPLIIWCRWLVISKMQGATFVTQTQLTQQDRQYKATVQAQLNDLKKNVADARLRISNQNRRGAKPSEDPPRQYDDTIQAQLDDLKNSLAAIHEQLATQGARRLTKEQADDIIKIMSPFKGQKIYVQALIGANDGIAFAQDFLAAFKSAGMDCDKCWTTLNVENFDNLIVSISKEDEASGNYPPAWWALSYELANLGFTIDPAIFMSESDLKSGEIRLQIGVNPGRKAVPPPYKFVYSAANGRVISEGIETPASQPATL